MSLGKPSRILLVLGTSAGGVGRHVRMLAEGLAREGDRVVVAGPVSTDEAFGFSEVAGFAGVPVADRPRPGRDLRAVLRLRALAAGADVVHAHGLRAGALAALALTGRRTRLVVTLHNALTAGGVVGAIWGVLERITAARADMVLVVAPDLGERMTARGARHVAPAVVPAPPLAPPSRLAADVHALLAAAAPARPTAAGGPGAGGDTAAVAGPVPGGETAMAPEEGAGLGERPVLLTVARLAQQKGLDTLLTVAGGEFAGGVRPLFVVAGDGPLRERLQGRIDEEGLPVVLLGERGDVADLLLVARALVVPSLWEGQPLSVHEALRAGVPVVGMAVGGIPGMVGDAGVLVPAGDVEGLRREISRLLTEPGLARRLGEAAAARVLPGEQDALRAVRAAYGGLRGKGAGLGGSRE
ncbi:glycosyltransferase family 4 protein [Sphaerisporangium sp. B11E5]|uniref:glycosyltransferase family 4 protein n=1 Tax=Sphaerisporangium sp. B11E5 TaxID=3153563 RepID=UPI00325E8D6F